MRILLFRTCVGVLLFATLLLSPPGHVAPALFKVEKNNISSYLLGTVHVGTPKMKGLPQYITQAIDSSKQVVVEVDLTKLSPRQVQKRSAPFMQLPTDKTLASETSKKTYQTLKNYFANLGIDIAIFNQHRPWAVMVSMLQLEYQKLGFSEQYGIDKQVLAYSKKTNKQVISLETLEQQLAMLSSLEQLGDEMFSETFEHLQDVEYYFLDLVEAWTTGDMDKLAKYYRLSFDDSKYGQYSEQVMLIDRNNQWIKTLKPLLLEHATFIAVGALHLPEQHGLISQLEQQGFSVTRISE
ncbi:TraB/GumN family protein [Pseudoalteromonas byunsanensis]|uniref:TraB/GumN family protein n=1 Tax=Pseudoalteromonas byunsanensis TaxID=327939 RepID=A0A1S1NCC8_9GAMM|nr:TraB/GumN family protein [Pseudoalteromonas byunsanensis]OHU96371.1 TraB/GumN family protein [Pseudoalteromonas byunsanensis]